MVSFMVMDRKWTYIATARNQVISGNVPKKKISPGIEYLDRPRATLVMTSRILKPL